MPRQGTCLGPFVRPAGSNWEHALAAPLGSWRWPCATGAGKDKPKGCWPRALPCCCPPLLPSPGALTGCCFLPLVHTTAAVGGASRLQQQLENSQHGLAGRAGPGRPLGELVRVQLGYAQLQAKSYIEASVHFQAALQ